MTTYNKLPYSNQFERGHSFNWAGKWTPGKYYYNNFYITDFVVYKNLLLVCRKDHLATNELEPEIVVTNGQTTDVRSAYWEFIVAVSGDSSYMIRNVTYDSVTKSITIFYGDDKHETFALDIDNNSVYIGTIEPTDTNKLWLDTTDDSNVLLKFYNTSNWDVIASTAVYINAANAYQKPNTGIPESDLASEVLAKLNGTQKVYECQLAEVILPQEGDICVVPGHEDSISISLEPGASLILFNVPYKTLRWAVDESVQTTAIAEIRYKGSLTNYYLYQPIPTGEEDVPTVFGGVIEADRSEFALVWDDDEVFAANLQYISLYSVIPDLAYVYRSGNWERIEDMSDVLRYSFQSLTSAQQKQARENIFAFPGPFENKTEITSNDSLAKYIRYNYRTPGIYSFTFNGKLSDGDTETGTYKVIVITSSTFTGNQYASISNYASFVLIEPDDDNSPFENRLYRVVERYESGSYQPTYVLEGYYIKPTNGIPASDIKEKYIRYDDEQWLSEQEQLSARNNIGVYYEPLRSSLSNFPGAFSGEKTENEIAEWFGLPRLFLGNLLWGLSGGIRFEQDVANVFSATNSTTAPYTKYAYVTFNKKIYKLTYNIQTQKYTFALDGGDRILVSTKSLIPTSATTYTLSSFATAFGITEAEAEALRKGEYDTILFGSEMVVVLGADASMSKLQLWEGYRGKLYTITKTTGTSCRCVVTTLDLTQLVVKSVNDLTNYYTKTQTYTKEEVQQLVSSLSAGAFIPVAELPTANADTYGLKIYLVPSAEPQSQNVKDEYITIRNGSEGEYTYSWEQIGSTAIDLSEYVTEDALETVLANYALASAIPTSLSQLTADETHRLVTDTEKSTWSGKQDALVSGTTIKTINNISILGHGNIDVSSGAGSVSWGGIGGTLYDQNDLQDALDAKQNTISDLQTIRNGASLGATAYQKPSTGIPVTDLANGVIPIVPAISTDITTDASSNDKTTSPKAVKTFVEGKGYTTNEGTVTGVTVGSTAYTPTNGIVTIPAYPNIPVTNVTVGGISVLDNNIAVIPAIPDVSQFITKSVNDLTNYYTKSQTYTKSEVDALVNAIQGFSYEVVATLPTASADTVSKIYLVPSSSAQTNNTKDEYITIENSGSYSWELIGNTNIDLSDYITTQELNTALGNYTTTSNLTTLLAGKQDVISDLSTIRSGAAAGATAYQKPSTGIPKTDLANAVQTSLDKTGTLETQLTALGNRIATIEQYITNGFTSLTVGNLTITSSMTNNGEDDHYEGEGVPAIISSRVGRRYLDIINNNWYTAIGTTTASQWVRDTNSITGNEIIEQNN